MLPSITAEATETGTASGHSLLRLAQQRHCYCYLSMADSGLARFTGYRLVAS